MNRITPVVAFALLLTAPIAHAAEPASDLGANAALRYWQAFSLMPELTDEQNKLAADWLTADVDDAATIALIESHDAALRTLRSAASLDRCDWGLDMTQGFDLLLPHLSKSRNLTRVACLAARRLVRHGKTREALATLDAAAQLAADTGRPPLLICQLVRVAEQSMVVQTLAAEAHRLTPAQRRDLAGDLPTMLAAPSAADGIAAERDVAVTWLRSLLDRPDELRRFRGELNGGEAPVPEPIAQATADLARAMTAAQVDMLEADYNALIAAADQPHEQFAAAERDVVEMAKANGHVLTITLLPSISTAAARFREFDTQVAMLRGAMLYLDGGVDAFNTIHDPAADKKPFHLAPDADQIVITSAMRDRNDKPLTLTVKLK